MDRKGRNIDKKIPDITPYICIIFIHNTTKDDYIKLINNKNNTINNNNENNYYSYS